MTWSCRALAVSGPGRSPGLQDHEGLDDHAALVVRRADDAAFGDRRMGEQRRLDLRAGDVVAGRDDHVVGARLVPEIAVLIHEVGVAGEVPAVLDVLPLALVGEVAATGRPAHRKPPDGARRQVAPLRIDDLRLVARHRLARRAGPDLVLARRDEDVQHLGRADAVHDLEPGRGLPRLEGRLRQRLAGRDAFAQGRDVVLAEPGEHRPIGGRRGDADRRAVLCDRRQAARPGSPSRSARSTAPACIGNSASAPRPKVKASGGEPMKRSDGSGRSTWSE